MVVFVVLVVVELGPETACLRIGSVASQVLTYL